MWTTTELNLWAGPDHKAEKVGVIDGIEKVLVTGRKDNGRVEVVVNGQSRWVTAGYFADEKPETGPTLGGPAPTVVGLRAVCTPASSWSTRRSAPTSRRSHLGTFRGDGEHAQGRASTS